MKFLADENFPVPSIVLLQQLGYDILSVITDHASITDEKVIELAKATERTILTFDKDYGELIFKRGYRPRKGVLFFRIHSFLPDQPAQLLHKLLSENEIVFENTLFVYDGVELRQRTYR